MITARAIARQLGLVSRVRPLRRGKVLLLRFADRSALWLSEAGARLAVPVPAATAEPVATEPAAYRFARAHAQAQGWALLIDRKPWPVPDLCHQGDWLSAPVARLAALGREILCTSALETLKGSPFSAEQLRAFLVRNQSPRAGGVDAMPLAPSPESQRRFLIFTKACLVQATDTRSAQIAQLEALCARDPTRSAVIIDPSEDSIKLLPLTKLRDHLRRQQPPEPEPSPDPGPLQADDTDASPTP